MIKKIINNDSIIKSLTKMVTDKNIVRSFLKGNTSIETLSQKGIQLAKPF